MAIKKILVDIQITGNIIANNLNISNWNTAANKAHDQNSDTILDEGNPNEVSSSEIRSHIDDSSIHGGGGSSVTPFALNWFYL